MSKNNTSSFIPRTPQEQSQFNQVVSFALVALVVGALGGFLSAQIFFKPEPPRDTVYIPEESGGQVVKEEELPLFFDVFSNTMIFDWRGAVSGTLVEKTNTSFTLERDGTRITVSVKEDYTTFRDAVNVQEEKSFAELSLGSSLRGNIWLGTRGAHPLSSTPGDIVGGLFFYNTEVDRNL